MDKWAKKWLKHHPDASMQEFAVVLSKRNTRLFFTMHCVEIAIFVLALALISLFK